MKTSRKVFSISATMLALVTISTPVVSFAATASSSTGNTTNVTQQVTDTVTLTGGYLTIDGGTNLDFGTAVISNTALSLYADKNNTGVDTWTTGTAGVAATTNDQMTGNGLTTATWPTTSPFTAESSLFTSTAAGGQTVDGVQVTDARGTNAGWSLYAYPSDLVNSAGQRLLGAAITISTGGGYAYNTNLNLDPAGLYTTGNTTTGPQTTAGSLSTNYTLPTMASGTKTLQVGTGTVTGTAAAIASTPNGSAAVQIATANPSTSTTALTGTGTNDLIYAQQPKLNIPAGTALAGTFNGTITYDLTTAP